jgi:hypothetical protein
MGQGRVTDILLPCGSVVETFFEQMGLNRAQEGKRIKCVCQAVLEVHAARLSSSHIASLLTVLTITPQLTKRSCSLPITHLVACPPLLDCTCEEIEYEMQI